MNMVWKQYDQPNNSCIYIKAKYIKQRHNISTTIQCKLQFLIINSHNF